jgi:hypothetical protein
MLMIDLGDEKKSLGVISVTCVTKQSLTGHFRPAGPAASSQVRGYLLAGRRTMARRTRRSPPVKKM